MHCRASSKTSTTLSDEASQQTLKERSVHFNNREQTAGRFCARTLSPRGGGAKVALSHLCIPGSSAVSGASFTTDSQGCSMKCRTGLESLQCCLESPQHHIQTSPLSLLAYPLYQSLWRGPQKAALPLTITVPVLGKSSPWADLGFLEPLYAALVLLPSTEGPEQGCRCHPDNLSGLLMAIPWNWGRARLPVQECLETESHATYIPSAAYLHIRCIFAATGKFDFQHG